MKAAASMTVASSLALPANMAQAEEGTTLKSFDLAAAVQGIVNNSIKNPLGIKATQQEIATSVKDKDMRTYVKMSEAEYNMVGRITLDNGKNGTGSIIRNPYDPQGVYVLTAAHVIADQMAEMEELSHIWFTANYLDSDGRVANFSSQPESIVMQYSDDGGYDTAVMRLSTTDLPVDIIPAEVYTNFQGTGKEIEAVGYSADKEGLSKHDGCTISQSQQTSMTATCHMGAGASGGPDIMSVNGKDYIVATNTAVYNGLGLSKHHSVDTSILRDASIIADHQTINTQQFMKCAIVTADRLPLLTEKNMYGTPTISITKNSKVILSSYNDDWTGIKMADGSQAFADSHYLQPVPCRQ